MNDTVSAEQARYELIRNEAGEHIITRDIVTGFEWQAKHIARQPCDDAEAAIAQLNAEAFGGHTDWTMPDRTQAQTILKFDTFDPMVDTEAFPDCPPNAFWTSTETPWDAEGRFVVHFDGGYVYGYYRNDTAFARAVRVPSQ